MTEPIHVPSFGPTDAEYAVVGQSPGRQEGEKGRPFVGPAGSLGKDWIDAAGIDPEQVRFLNVYEYVLLGGESPSSTDVKHGIDRVLRELAELPNLKAVVLFGSYAARCAFTLKGGITRAQGRQGTLTLIQEDACNRCAHDKMKHTEMFHWEGLADFRWWDCQSCECKARDDEGPFHRSEREIPCIACLHPSYVLRQKSLRQRQQLDNECRSVVARLTFLDQPLVLPEVTFQEQGSLSGGEIEGIIGLDTETEFQAGKRVDPRKDPLLITGLSDGRVLTDPPVFLPGAEPIVHNVPFDPVVEIVAGACGSDVASQPRWHCSKMLAHLCGESDTTMKGLATRLLNRPMMEYDPDLRKRAAEKIRRGVGIEDDDVETFSAYCVQDAIAHRDLYLALRQRADTGTKWLYDNVERPMMRLYSKWTATGVFRLDREAALKKRDVLDGQIRKLRRELESASGVDSPHKHAQLQKALDLPSTDAKYVERIWPKLNKRQRHILTVAGRVRSLERQQTTYLDAWLECLDDLLSTNWRPTAAWTGRPGSAEFNLQNIPGPCGDCTMCLRGEIRQCAFNLKPLLLAPEGMTLYELDGSQAELRVAAHLSQDPAMHLAFTEGIEIDGEIQYDLHTWAQKKLEFPSRREAKIRVLATFYGQTTEGLKASPEIQEALRRTFAGYTKWANKVKRLSIVPGLFGRKLFVPPHPNQGHREREAIAAPSQGGSADVLKLQALALEKAGFDTRHAIHDSVLVAVPDDLSDEDALRGMIETMETAVELTVPLKVEGGFWPHD